MSSRAYEWVRGLRKSQLGGVSDAARLTLFELAEWASPDGTGVWPSVATLAAQREVSERTVQRHLRDLEGAGLIRRGDQRLVDHVPPSRRPTVYDLTMRVVDNSAVRGDTDDTPPLFWGDTDGRSGVTPDVTQTENLTSIDHPAYSTQESAGEISTDLTDQPDRECLHGWPIEYVGRGRRRVPKCPSCRRIGCVTPAPPVALPSPEKQAHTQQLLEQVRNRKQVAHA